MGMEQDLQSQVESLTNQLRNTKRNGAGLAAGSVFGAGSFLVGLICLCMYGCPQFNVYEQRMSGEAQLAKSMAERRIQIQDAEGKKEAATYLAQAEVERAKGVAQANQVIGNSLKNNDEYLKWLYIEGLKERTGAETIYVPTEAGLPIIEAGRLNKQISQQPKK